MSWDHDPWRVLTRDCYLTPYEEGRKSIILTVPAIKLHPEKEHMFTTWREKDGRAI